jgi:hypothetical protein
MSVRTVKWVGNRVHALKISLLQSSAHCETSFPSVLTVFVSRLWTLRAVHLGTAVTEHKHKYRGSAVVMHTCGGGALHVSAGLARVSHMALRSRPAAVRFSSTPAAIWVSIQDRSIERNEEINRTGIPRCVLCRGHRALTACAPLSTFRELQAFLHPNKFKQGDFT